MLLPENLGFKMKIAMQDTGNLSTAENSHQFDCTTKIK